MRTKLFVDLPVLAFSKQMQIDFAHDRAVLIRITRDLLRSVMTGYPNSIIQISRRIGNRCLKKSLAMNSLRLDRAVLRLRIDQNVDLFRVRSKHANHQIVLLPMRPEDSK